MNNLLKLTRYSVLDISWITPHYFLKGWDYFFKEEIGTIALLHLIAITFSTLFNCCACLSQWQLSIGIMLFRRIMAGGICTSKRRLDGKVVIVTGSNSGIGKETARNLAERGATIVMACRDMDKAENVAAELRRETGAKIDTMKLDLSSLESVRSFVKEFKSKYEVLHILVNNAGIMMLPYGLTKDGFEMQYGVNHFGHFLLTNLLLPSLKRATEARIINVTSAMHVIANMDIDDLLYKKGYNRSESYANSKLANILFTRSLADILKDTNIKVFSVHPGVVQSDLGRNLPFGLGIVSSYIMRFVCKNTKGGAQTSIYCAIEAQPHPNTFFSDCGKSCPSEAAQDLNLAKKLWKVSEKLVKLEKA